MTIPVVAIIGRANVGKSTLFNKIVGKRKAIVHDAPGVTRDRNYQMAEWFGKSFMTIDTGGIDIAEKGALASGVKEQARLALEEAHSIILVVDSRQGLTLQDKEMVDRVRKSSKSLFLAVNKVDHPKQEFSASQFWELGTKNIFPLSAEHGIGIIELIEELVDDLPGEPVFGEASSAIKIAVVGRPNVGKSSLVNRLLKSTRCVVSETAGTTRDSIDSHLTHNGASYVLIDTAGIRRKGKTVRLLDKYSAIMALKAIDRCNIAALVIDSAEGITDQDAAIAGYALERGCGCLILANKWDLARQKESGFAAFKEKIHPKIKFLDFAPVFAVSAKTGYNLAGFFPQARKVYREYSRKVATGPLNDFFMRAVKKNPMSSHQGKFLKMFYSTQVKACPPTFRCFVNYPQGIHFSYRRYLINGLRETFGFAGTPVRLIFSRRNSRRKSNGAA
ncbi:MAG: ribosome biogenesis GTPase Der [Nitrospinales bacterium]